MTSPDMRKVRDIVEACLLLICLVGSGAGIGYWAGTERTRYVLIDERRDRLQEIERMQRTYRDSIGMLTGRVESAANAAGDAAQTAATAADTAQDAATSVAKTAAKVSSKVTGKPGAEMVTEPENRALSSDINRANARIGSGK